MTNEEIRRVANEINATHLNWKTVRHVGFETERLLIELVSQAYEEAARTVCPFCEAGLEIVRSDKLGEYEYSHGVDSGDGIAVAAECDAARIHALKDSLVQEPVAST